jgi:nitrile hydratase
MRPAGTEGWTQDQLAGLVTRDSMIGTGLALAPAAVNSMKPDTQATAS